MYANFDEARGPPLPKSYKEAMKELLKLREILMRERQMLADMAVALELERRMNR
jgi:hypothetical protein